MRNTTFLLLAVLLAIIPNSECQCTFPTSLAGTWITSGQGTWIVNSSHIQDFRTVSDSGKQVSGNTPFTSLTFECQENQGDTKYVLKSEAFEIFNSVYISLYICMDIREITTSKYIFYKATDEDTNGDQFTALSDYDDVCNSVNYELPYRYRVALKSGYETTELIQCPSEIFGTYTYDTCTDTASNTTSMDVCDSRQQLIYNYTLCNTPQMFTREGTLDCVYFETNDTVTYLTVYNRDNTPPDESSYFRFTCMALELSGNDVRMTVYPERCIDSQNVSAIDSPGYAVYFTPFYLCPITSESEENNWWIWVVIGGGAFLFLLLIIIIIIICCCCCRRKKKKKKNDEESVKEESDSEAGSTRPPSRESSRRNSDISKRSSIKSMDSGIGEPQPTPVSSRSEEEKGEEEKQKKEDAEDDDDPEKVTELIISDEGEKEVEDKTSRPSSSQLSRMSDLPPSTIPPDDDRKTPASIRERHVDDEPDNDDTSIRAEETVEPDSQSIHGQEEPRAPTPDDTKSVKDDSQYVHEQEEPRVSTLIVTKSVEEDSQYVHEREEPRVSTPIDTKSVKDDPQSAHERDEQRESTPSDTKSVNDDSKSFHEQTEPRARTPEDTESVKDDSQSVNDQEEPSVTTPGDTELMNNHTEIEGEMKSEKGGNYSKPVHSATLEVEETKSVQADNIKNGKSMDEDTVSQNDGEIKTDQTMNDSESVHGDTQRNEIVYNVKDEGETKSEHEQTPLETQLDKGPDVVVKPDEDTKSTHSEKIMNDDTKTKEYIGEAKSEPDETLPHESESEIDSDGEKSDFENSKEENIGDDDKVRKEPDAKLNHETVPVKHNIEPDDSQTMASDTKRESEKMETDDIHTPEKDPVKENDEQEKERRSSIKEDDRIVEDKTKAVSEIEEKKEESDKGYDVDAVVVSTRKSTSIKQKEDIAPNRSRQQDDQEEHRDSGRQTEVRSDEEEPEGTQTPDEGQRVDDNCTSDDEYQRQYHKIGAKGSKSYEPSGALTTVLVTRDEEERKRMKIKSKSKKQRMTKLARKRTRKLGQKSDKHADIDGETGYNENGMTSTDDEMLYDHSGNKAAFMKQYVDKKRLEHILDEQHYWSDPDDENDGFGFQSEDGSIANSEVDEYVTVIGTDGLPTRVKKSDLSGYDSLIITDDESSRNAKGSKDALDFVKRGEFVTVLGSDNEPWLVKKSNLVKYLSPDTEVYQNNDNVAKGKNAGKNNAGTEQNGNGNVGKDNDQEDCLNNALQKEQNSVKDNIAFVKENDIVTVIGPDSEYKRVRKQDLLNILNSDKDSNRQKKKKKKQMSDDPAFVEKGEYVTIVGADGITRRVKKADLKLYLDRRNNVSDEGIKDKDGNDIYDLGDKLDFVEEGDYITVIGSDGQQRRIRKTDLAKFLEQESEKQKKLNSSSIDNLAYVENPENIDENISKTKLNRSHDDQSGKRISNMKTDSHPKGAKTKFINVKERPHEAGNTSYKHKRHGEITDNNVDILSDFCDTDLDKISDRDSGLSDEEEEAVDVILTQDQQQMIVNMLFDEEMNLRPQFDRDENGRIVRRLDNTVIYDPHTGRFTYIKRLGQLFKVPRLRRNDKGRPTGGYIEDSYGPKEVPKTSETSSKGMRTASSKSSDSFRTKSSSPEQKRTRPLDGRNVGFVMPEDDFESMNADELEYHKRGRRDLSSAFRKALSKRLFRKKRKRGASDNLPEVQLKKAWGGDPLLSVNGGNEFRQVTPGRVSPLFSRSGTKMTPNISTPGQQRRFTGTNDPEQLQRYRDGLKSDQRILENLQDKLNKDSDSDDLNNDDRPLDARLAFEDVREEGVFDDETTDRNNGCHAGHDNGLYYTTTDGRLVIRERGCPELKAMSQKDPLFMIVRRPEDIEKEEQEKDIQNGGRNRKIHTAPVVLQTTEGSPRDSEHAQKSEESLSTQRSNMSQMTSIDDNRLRRLLEELYKDKKYFDYYIDTTKPKSDAIIHSKGLAEHGRGYLLERADYWERRGPLPPRPPQTAVGWRMQRQQTLRDEQQRASTTNSYTQESIPGAIDSPRKDRSTDGSSGMFTDSNEKLADDSFRSSELRQSEA